MLSATRAGTSSPQQLCRVDHGWLPLVLPASARRFSVEDAALRECLASAGAEIVSAGADVEIGDDPRGDAPLAIVPLQAELPDGGPRAVRAARRAGGHALVRARALRVARSLRPRYASV